MIAPTLLIASGRRVLAGQSGEVHIGAGKISIARAPIHGVDDHLWLILKLAVDDLRLPVLVSSVDTGQHVPGSRHYDGRAVDISKVGLAGGRWKPATLNNADAGHLANWLLANGFRIGEGGPWPAILFGPPHTRLNPSSIDHSTHLHVSLPKVVPGEAEADEPVAE